MLHRLVQLFPNQSCIKRKCFSVIPVYPTLPVMTHFRVRAHVVERESAIAIVDTKAMFVMSVKMVITMPEIKRVKVRCK